MRTLAWTVIALACEAAARGGAGAAIVEQPAPPYQGGYTWPYSYGKTQSPGDLTIEQLRNLGLTPEQIQKVADARRDIERQRAALEAQIQAANSELARLYQEMRTLTTTKLVKTLEAVMTPEQAQAWRQQEARDQARQWLVGYRYWLKLTDAQVEEAVALLAPVFAKYSKGEQDLADARARLAELRRADQVDVAAVDAAEKAVAQLTSAAQNVYQKRHAELLEAMRPALTPDQLEKVDKMQPARKAPQF